MTDRSYADCFRILRDAVKDGIIRDWCYGADMPDGGPGIDVYPGEGRGHGFESFRDPDGTKGDIGLLREAADYVGGLQCKNVLAQLDITGAREYDMNGLTILCACGEELQVDETMQDEDGGLAVKVRPHDCREYNHAAVRRVCDRLAVLLNEHFDAAGD